MPNIEVLQQLRRVAEEAPEDLLHMNVIYEEASCGTAHCLLGWASIDPWFQKNTRINDAIPIGYDQQGIDGLRVGPILRDIFEFDEYSRDVSNLFAFKDCIGPHDVSKEKVINNIDRLIRGKHTVPYTRRRRY